jgi:hypothetical protein
MIEKEQAKQLFPDLSGHVQNIQINGKTFAVCYEVEGDLVGESWRRISYLTRALDINGEEVTDTDGLDSIRDFLSSEIDDELSAYI